MAEDAKKSTPAKKSESEAKQSEQSEPGSEKAASAAQHTLHPGVRSAMVGPSQDDLNPAYAPLKADEE